MEWVPRSECPICARVGEVRWVGVTDRIWHVPGEWCYRQCRSHDVLWLDPQPANFSTVATLYPVDYPTHGKPGDLLAPRQGWIANFRLRVKCEILRHSFGYPLECRDTWAHLLGQMASTLPIIRQWAGYTVRFLHARNGRLLDVGSGNGTFLMLMAKLGWEVMGIEPDPIAARYAQGQGLEVVVGRLEDIKFEPESFDAITLSHVIEHISDPVHVFKVLSYALKPGGLLVSISPNPCGILSRIFGTSWRELDPPRHLVLLGPRALAELSCNFGLQPIVWTGNWNADWVARESISLRLCGDAFSYRGQWFPKLLAVVLDFLTLIHRNIGEEVVLIARKEDSP